jgi:hypothetical protein
VSRGPVAPARIHRPWRCGGSGDEDHEHWPWQPGPSRARRDRRILVPRRDDHAPQGVRDERGCPRSCPAVGLAIRTTTSSRATPCTRCPFARDRSTARRAVLRPHRGQQSRWVLHRWRVPVPRERRDNECPIPGSPCRPQCPVLVERSNPLGANWGVGNAPRTRELAGGPLVPAALGNAVGEMSF